MHGATIETTYAVKVKNVGEKDYNNKNFYYIGTKGTDSNNKCRSSNRLYIK